MQLNILDWLKSKTPKNSSKFVILGGQNSERPNYYLKSNWIWKNIDGQITKIKIIKDEGDFKFIEIDESFVFFKYKV